MTGLVIKQVRNPGLLLGKLLEVPQAAGASIGTRTWSVGLSVPRMVVEAVKPIHFCGEEGPWMRAFYKGNMEDIHLRRLSDEARGSVPLGLLRWNT